MMRVLCLVVGFLKHVYVLCNNSTFEGSYFKFYFVVYFRIEAECLRFVVEDVFHPALTLDVRVVGRDVAEPPLAHICYRSTLHGFAPFTFRLLFVNGPMEIFIFCRREEPFCDSST